MQNPKAAGYTFHASALALGGQITRPFSDVLEAQAATSLPSTGGYSSARAENFRYRDLITFDRAYSVVTGSSGEGTHETLVTSVVEGLNIMNMVTADRVVGRLTSSYTQAAKPEEQKEQSLLPLGSYFVNLRIAGTPVALTSRDVIHCTGTFSDLDRNVKFLQQNEHYRRASIFDDPVVEFYQDAKIQDPQITMAPGSTVNIKGFGRVSLGEYIVSRDSRRLTMIVCHLGCAVEGTTEVANLQGNGIPG
jgi:hypothetical protein